MVFARHLRCIQRAFVELGDASSGFLQFAAMAFRGHQRSNVVSDIATRCSLMPPRTHIRYMAGSACRRRQLSQH
jgi:hypothetical protein